MFIKKEKVSKDKKGFTPSLENGIALAVFLKNETLFLFKGLFQKLFPARKPRKNTMPFFNAGFTLIELLVVIAIIGIMSSIVTASLNSARSKARDARRLADISTIQIALEMFYDKDEVYPQALSELTESGSRFLPIVPVPPAGAGQTGYAYVSIGEGDICASYHLGASLEDKNNQSLNVDADFPVGTVCGNSGTDFDGNAANCDGGTAANEDNCYDIEP